METVTITIGRNVADKPMTASSWESFHERVRALLNPGEVYAEGAYTGAWEGVSEDAAILFGAVPDAGPVRDALARLAAEYGQDAIGLSVGEPELIGPPTTTQKELANL